jgi:hypothetical protein
VLVPNAKKIFRDAPPGYAYEYRTTGNGQREHLSIPAVEATFTLVGLDKNPDGLRGPFRDVVLFTEAGYVGGEGLYKTYVSEVQLQMQGLRHAFAVFESSTPKTTDHDFNTEFKPDAQIRRAYSRKVITDNTSLTQEEIEDEIRKSGGRNSDECKRELFNENDPDPEQMVIPEFVEAVHVVEPRDWPRPQFALGYEGIDPGTTDPLGFVMFYADWARQTVVIERAFMRPNMSTGDFVTNEVRPMEANLWGTEHETPELRAQHHEDDEPIQMLRIRDAVVTPRGKVWEAPHGSLVYWDKQQQSLVANPYSRISDVAKRFILDLNKDYALNVRAADKEPGSADADLEFLRKLFGERHAHNGMPKIVILNNGLTDQLIQQLRSGMWKLRDGVHKVDWARSKLLGHLDCIAALKYAVRDVRWNRNPNPPAVRDLNAPNIYVPPRCGRMPRVPSCHLRRCAVASNPHPGDASADHYNSPHERRQPSDHARGGRSQPRQRQREPPLPRSLSAKGI